MTTKTIQQRIDFVLHDLKKIVKLEDARIKEADLESSDPEYLKYKRNRYKLHRMIQDLAVIEAPEAWNVAPEEPKADEPKETPTTKKKK